MEVEYTPIKPEDIFPKIDSETIAKFLKGEAGIKEHQIETIDYLLNSLSIAKEDIKHEDLFIRNYIYATTITRKHLLEINERIKTIKAQANQISNRESYPYRKLMHFQKKNEKAKDEIVHFLCYGLAKYVSEHNEPYSDLINRNDEDKMWLSGPTYDYNYNHKYYNPDYDFSTFVKFFNTPNVNILDSFNNIDDTIALKEKDTEKYYQKVIDTVDNNNLLENMAERIGNNYHFHKRKEIFETMATLFKEEKFTTFILTATIQIEGMFYELVTIRYGEKENQGTLVEKVDKTFSKNTQQKHALYPYFAFDIPDLRNKVAHIGIVEDSNIKNTAYELVLDLHCILSLAEQESMNKFKNVIYIISKIKDVVSSNDFDSDDKQKKAIAEHIFGELYIGNATTDDYFWNLILKPYEYEEELNYYQPNEEDDNHIYIKTMVNYFHAVLQHEVFWQVVLEYCGKFSEIEHSKINDMGTFIEKLKNMFIPILNGKAKDICIDVNKELQSKTIIN